MSRRDLAGGICRRLLQKQTVKTNTVCLGGFKYFFCSPLGKIPNLTFIFFKGVETC